MDNKVTINLSNGIVVNIDKGNIEAKYYDLVDNIEDLLKFKKQYKPKEIIKLSDICDTMFNIMYCGIDKEKKEISFKLC